MTGSGQAELVSLGSPRFSTAYFGSLLLTDAVFPAGHELESHFHDRTVLGVTIAGIWDSVVGQTRLSNRPGTLHIEPAGESHSNRFLETDVRVVLIQPDPTDDRLYPFRSLLERAARLDSGSLGIRSAMQLQHEIRLPDDLSGLAVETAVLGLLIEAKRNVRERSASVPNWMKRIVEYVHANLAKTVSLTDLSAIAGVSVGHFTREFRRVHGVGAASYMRRMRLQAAMHELVHSERSIAEIACAAGFADQSHFTRRFHREFGITPASFRALNRQRTKM